MLPSFVAVRSRANLDWAHVHSVWFGPGDFLASLGQIGQRCFTTTPALRYWDSVLCRQFHCLWPVSSSAAEAHNRTRDTGPSVAR